MDMMSLLTSLQNDDVDRKALEDAFHLFNRVSILTSTIHLHTNQ